MIVEISEAEYKFFKEFDEQNDPQYEFTEELGEAIAAINHYRRGKIDIELLLEELADVIISTTHIALVTFNTDEEEFNKIIESKIQKGLERIR